MTNFLLIRTFSNINIQDLTIVGSNSISKEDIITFSSLKVPSRLIFIKTRLLENELRDNLYLKNILIIRQLFPFGLKIFIQEREPIANGEKVKEGLIIPGYIDIEGVFIKKNIRESEPSIFLPIRIYGWNYKFRDIISKILVAYKDNKDLAVIKINPNGFIILEERILNKIVLGLNHSKIDIQLELINDIKNQLTDKKFIKKIETLDLTDPSSPEIKVFKP